MFNKVCGYIIIGASAVMMGGLAIITGLWVREEVVKIKEKKKCKERLSTWNRD